MGEKFLIEIIGDASQVGAALNQTVDSAKAAAQKTAQFFAEASAKMEAQYQQFIRQRMAMDQMYADMFDRIEAENLAAVQRSTQAMIALDQQRQRTIASNDAEILREKQAFTQSLVSLDRQKQAALEQAENERLALIRDNINQEIAMRRAAYAEVSSMAKTMTNTAMFRANTGVGNMDYTQALANANFIKNFKSTYGNGPVGWQNMMKSNGMSTEAAALLASMRGVGVEVEKTKTLWDEFASKFKAHALMMPAYIATWGAVQVAIEGASQAFDNIVRAQKEQVIQSFYYSQAGLKGFPASDALNMTGQSQTTLNYAIALAREYGADVLQVQEQIGLWIKQTHDLDAALYMTNEALKVQMDTGMPLEDLYRSTLGVLSQYHKPLSDTNALFDVAIGLAAHYAGGLQMLGGEGQDAAAQIVHGMDTASAVMAKFGLSFEQAGALVVTQLQTLAKEGGGSGASIGENIASALAALEKGAAYNALDQLGIKLEHNNKLIDQLAENWNKATKSGKTLGDTLGQVVRPGQFETLENIVHQVKLFDQALKDANDAEKGHVSDKLATTLFGTLNVQLKQAQAGFQAVGMSLGVVVLPELNALLKFLNNDLIPSLIANGKNWVDLGGDVLKALGIFLGFKAISFIPALMIGIRDTVVEASLAMGTAWEAMGAAFGIGAAEVVAADDTIQTSVRSTALVAESAAGAIGAAFVKLIPLVGWAFTALQLAKTGVDAINAHQDQVELSDPNKWIKFHTQRMAYDEQQIAELNSMSPYGASPAQTREYSEDYDLNLERIKFIQKNRPDNAKKAASSQLNDIWNQMKKDMLDGYMKLKGIFPTPPGGPTDEGSGATAASPVKGMSTDYGDFTANLNAWTAVADMAIEKYKGLVASSDVHIANIEREIKLYPGNIELLSKLSQANGQRTKYIEQENAAIKIKMAMDQANINTATQHINHTKNGSKEQIGWINAKTESIRKLNEDTAALNANNDSLQRNIDLIAQQAQTFLGEYDKRLGLDEKKFTDAKSLGGKQHAAGQFLSDFQSDTAQFFNWLYQQPPEVINALLPMYKTWQETNHETVQKNKEDIQSFTNEAAKSANELTASLGDKSFSALTGMLPESVTKKPEMTYYKDMANFQRDMTDNEQKYSDLASKLGKDNTQVEQLRQALDTWEQIVPLAAEYAYRLQVAEDSPLYKGLEKVVTDLTDAIGSGVMDDIFGTNAINQHIQALETENNMLNQQKDLVDEAYNMSKYHSAEQIAQHINYLNTLKREEDQIKANEKAEQERLAHPPLLKKIAMDFTKAMVDGFLQQLQDQAKNSILSKIFGVGKNNPMMQAADQLAQTISADAQGSMYWNTQQLQNIFMDSPNSFYNSVQTLVNANNSPVNGGEGYGGMGAAGTLASIMAGPGGSNGISGIVAGVGTAFGMAISAGSNRFWNGSSPGTPGTIDPNLYAAYIQAGMDPATAAQMASFVAPSSTSPFGGIQGLLGGAMSAYGGFETSQQGGILNNVLGGLQGGLGVLAATGNPILAAGAGLIDFLGGMFGGNKNPAQMPDIFQTQAFGQSMANLAGNGIVPGLKGTWTANGQQFTEDPSLAQAMGGQGELMFISNWIKSNPQEAQTLLGPTVVSEFSGLQNVTANGGPIANGKNGNITLSNGVTMNWQALTNAANQAAQAILNFKDQLQQSQMAMVSLNQVGTGGFFPYNWSVPGYNMQPGNGISYVGGNAPTGPTNPTSPTQPGPVRGPIGGGGGGRAPGPIGGGSARGMAAYAYSGTGSSVVTTPLYAQLQVNLDGRVVARTVQAYQIQTNQAGYSYIT